MIITLDLETTGIDFKNDKIIEVALLKFDEETFEIIDKFETLINPEIHIPEITSNITNIFDNDVINSPIFNDDIKQKIKNFIGDFPILGHNTNFDRDFLVYNGINLDLNIVLDTFHLSNIILHYEKSLNLGNLCESLKIDLVDAHRAMDDTIATFKLFKELVFKFRDLENDKKDIINFIFSKTDERQFGFYKKLFNFENDIIKEEVFIKKILKVVKKYKAEKIDETKNVDLKVNDNIIQNIFSSLPNSELRENQLKMSNIVLDTILNDKKTVIEAPTGVGKTFAYLIPSIVKSIKFDEQIIVSTNTKTLQDQIFFKDLNFLSKNLKYDFKYSKLKGKKNYLSVYRFFDYIFSNYKFDSDEIIFISKLALWLFDTIYGELDELTFYPKENYLLREINSDHFLVLFENNEYKEYEYIFKAREKAKKSNIVIINHSLLIQDSTSSKTIFGQIKNLIIDEAHNLEDTVTDARIKSFTLDELKNLVDKLKNTFKKSNIILDNVDINFDKLISEISLVFDLVLEHIIKQNNFGNENFSGLINDSFFLENESIGNLLNNITNTYNDIYNLFELFQDKDKSLINKEISFLQDILEILKICLTKDSKNTYIPMFSYTKNGNNTMYYTILNPGKFLKNILWDKIDSIILTSATLKVNSEFLYIKNILALDIFDFVYLESDFDYSKQALLFIPQDLGSIKYLNPKINDFVLRFLNIVKGKTLVLLTSFSSIRDLYLTLNIPLKKLGTQTLAQGVAGSKHKIANHFKKYSSSSVILGTDSFWEGVDLPGDDLKYLIIHKFPFSVPTDPVFIARSKLYSDPFREYSIPKAIIKTKQGFGRLIRTKKDTGIVILLDDRYHNTNWGIAMKSSFPHNINIKTGTGDYFLDLILKKSI